MTITTAKQRTCRAAPPRLAPLAVAALLLASCPAHADWRVTPTLLVSEIWTDNVNLTEDALAHSDLITQVSPGITVSNRSRRLTVNATAQVHAFSYLHNSANRSLDDEGVSEDSLSYDQRRTNNVQRTYNGSLKSELAQDLLYLDARASRGQAAISPFGPRAGSGDMYSRNNRTDVTTWSISPYLAHRFGSTADGLLRYTRDSVDGDDVIGFRRTGGDTIQASLTSGTAFRTIGWGLNYSRQQLEGDLYGDSSTENLAANVRYYVSRRLSLTANAGYDRYEYEGLNDGDEGANWSLGFIFTPSLRSSVQASFGRHFYGNTGSLALLHRTRHLTTNITYADTITTSRQQFLLPATIDTAALLDSMFATAYPDPVERERIVQAYIQATGLPPSLADSVNYLSNRFMRQKALRGSLAYRKGRSNGIVSLHATERNAISDQMSDSPLLGSQQGTLYDNVRQYGFSANYTYRLTSRSNLVAAFDLDRSHSLTNDDRDYQRSVRVGVSRRFGDLLGTIDLRHRTGDLSRFESGKYTERALVASLSMQF